MSNKYVIVSGEKYFVKNDKLILGNLGIKSIENIKNLELFRDLKELYLFNNEISKINGLDKLTSLEKLNLYGYNIEIIENLSPFKNLKTLYLSENQISEIQGIKNLINLEDVSFETN